RSNELPLANGGFSSSGTAWRAQTSIWSFHFERRFCSSRCVSTSRSSGDGESPGVSTPGQLAPRKRTAKRWQSFHRRWSFPLTTIDNRASFRGSVQATRNLGATADELASSHWTLAVQCLVVPALRTVKHASNDVWQTLADKPDKPPVPR